MKKGKSLDIRIFNANLTHEIPNNVKVIHCEDHYVADGIGEDYRLWDPLEPVIISAQTGAGKNTFILKRLIPYAYNQGTDIMILSNRTALMEQTKLTVAKDLQLDKIYTTHGIKTAERLGHVIFSTYQALSGKLAAGECFENVGFVIADEAHFFYSDATFNKHTAILLKQMPHVFKNAVRIYLTATPKFVLEYIEKAEITKEKIANYALKCQLYPKYSPVLNAYIDPDPLRFNTPKILLYEFERNYKHLNVLYSDSRERIIESIKKSEFKSIIFVDSRERGKKIKNDIGVNAIYVDSETKNDTSNRKSYDEIIKNERFDAKVLVTTAALDNGININDPAVKNIVIFCTDEVQIVQMLGRKRIEEGEQVTLYLYEPSIAEWERRLQQTNEILDACELLEKSPDKFANKCLLSDRPEASLIRKMTFAHDGKHFFNELAVDSYKYKFDYAEEILNQLITAGRGAHIKKVLKLLNVEYSEKNWIDVDNTEKVEALILFLENAVDKPANTAFISTFRNLYTTAFGKTNADRNDREWGKTLLNNRFEAQNLPYVTEGTKETMVLRRRGVI